MGTKTAISQQFCCARSSRPVHLDHRVETHLFSNSAKSFDIVRLHHKHNDILGLEKIADILGLENYKEYGLRVSLHMNEISFNESLLMNKSIVSSG